MMWAQGSFGSIVSTDQDKANCNACYDIAIPASYSHPRLEHLRSSNDTGDFAVAPNGPHHGTKRSLTTWRWDSLSGSRCRDVCGCADSSAARRR
ncbi:hypothetical protein MRX96_033308 [Rhipicephalus microplus]